MTSDFGLPGNMLQRPAETPAFQRAVAFSAFHSQLTGFGTWVKSTRSPMRTSKIDEL